MVKNADTFKGFVNEEKKFDNMFCRVMNMI